MKTPIKDILNFAFNKGLVRKGEATTRALQVALNLRLIVADKIDSNGVAKRFRLTDQGYALALRNIPNFVNLRDN
tara:strand:- start:92 stop:316 length:225 start_codon:yes stop_codon:yes gene_type:complete